MYYTLTRLASLIVVALFQVHRLMASGRSEFQVNSEHDKALYSHSFHNMSTTTMEKCLGSCLANCLCMSFQICSDRKCQLCSSSKYLTPSALRSSHGCTNYDFDSQEGTQVNNQQCGRTCMTAVNCCMTSNPCLNGGTCLPRLSNKEKRFRCKCPDGYEGDRCNIVQCPLGYTGENCHQPIKSCRGYSDGSRVPGHYTVLDASWKSFKVFCDFDSNSSMTWTLVQSYSLDKKDVFMWEPLSKDFSKNKNNPSWSKYRLPKSRMESIQQDSTKWRITCRYETDGVLYTDYARASNTEVDILTFENDGCVDMEYINIRGQHCEVCSAYMVQSAAILHFNSPLILLEACDFKPSSAKLCGEDNFGFYLCSNDNHRCSSTDSSTTQTWFGGE